MTTHPIDRDRLRRYLSHAAMLLPPGERVVTVEEGLALLDALEQAEARIQAVRDVCDRALAVKVQGSTDTDVAMAAAGATILRALDAP